MGYFSQFKNNKEQSRSTNKHKLPKSLFFQGVGWEKLKAVLVKKDGNYLFLLNDGTKIEASHEEVQKYNLWDRVWFWIEEYLLKLTREKLKTLYGEEKLDKVRFNFVDYGVIVIEGRQGWYVAKSYFVKETNDGVWFFKPISVNVYKDTNNERFKYYSKVEYINI